MRIKHPSSTPEYIKCPNTFIKKWRPIDGCLIEESNGDFVLPTHHSLIGEEIYNSHKQSMKKNYLWSLLICICICIYLNFTSSEVKFNQLLIYIILLFIITIDNFLNTLTIGNLKIRAEFCYQVNNSCRKTSIIFIPFFIFIILAQTYIATLVGGTEQVIINYGNYYPEISVSSLWRFLIGAFIHGDYTHWGINMIITILFSSIIPSIKVKNIFVLFIVSAIISHVITYIVDTNFNSLNDALCGVSGGSFALLAFSICHFSFEKKYFTIVFSLSTLVIFSTVSAMLLTNNTSHIAHLSGFILGGLYYLINRKTDL